LTPNLIVDSRIRGLTIDQMLGDILKVAECPDEQRASAG